MTKTKDTWLVGQLRGRYIGLKRAAKSGIRTKPSKIHGACKQLRECEELMAELTSLRAQVASQFLPKGDVASDLIAATAGGKMCVVMLRDGSVITGVYDDYGNYESACSNWFADGSAVSRDPSLELQPDDIIRVITTKEYNAMLDVLEGEGEMRCAECDCENGGDECNWIKAGPPA